MPGLDRIPTFLVIATKPVSVVEHRAEIGLAKPSIHHSL